MSGHTTGYNWSWPQISSLTAMKYQRHGYVEKKPFLPGQRYSARRELDNHVKGYKELRQELAKVRFSVEKDKAGVTDNTEKVVLKANFYKSVIGVKTSRGPGNTYTSQPVGRVGYFSAIQKI